MEELRVLEKPDWISWDDVQKCIHDAQLTNTTKGFDMSFGHQTGAELCEKVGDGYCFVVLNEKNAVVGTITLKVMDIKSWWHRGSAGYHCFEAISPDYRGTDAYFDMHAHLIKKEKQLGLKVIYADTAEKNKVILKASKKTGWKHVQFTTFQGCDYYSIYLVKWYDTCPFSDRYINFMFKLSKVIIKIIYKPGRINRLTNWIKIQ